MSSQQVSVPLGPERQRILNVLAQRRYRQRKRERLQSLETKLNTGLAPTNTLYASGGEIQLHHPMQPPILALGNPATPADPFYNLYPDLIIGASNASCMCLTPCTSTCSMSERSSPYGSDQFGTNPLLHHGNTPYSISSMSDSRLSADLQDLETSQFTFPAERTIEIPTLKTMEASLRIAHMLGLVDEFLDLTINKVLDVSKLSVPIEDLPENLRPTEAQLLLPHYPVIDVLPWPSVRTRLICLFSQPDQLRPPVARGPMAIMRLMQDIDHESEGLRITIDTNGHEYDEKSWEVGQAVLKDWWWALGPEIVSNSNRLRHMRGAPDLQLSIS